MKELLVNKQNKISNKVLSKTNFIYCMNGTSLVDKRVVNDNLRLHKLADKLVDDYRKLIIKSYVPQFNYFFKSNKHFHLSTIGNFRSEFSNGFNNFCNLHLINELIKELKVDELCLTVLIEMKSKLLIVLIGHQKLK